MIKKLLFLACLLLIIHPLIELDYLLADKLIVRISTIINFIVLPIIFFLTFLNDKNKKRNFIFFFLYGLALLIYFYFHCRQGLLLNELINLPDNFIFTYKDEAVYILTLLLPLLFIYVFKVLDIDLKKIKIITALTSLFISFPIVISNIFLFGQSTYDGYTIDNIFSWFLLPYNSTNLQPRKYACKFFFQEGNTIGIILIIILPLLYYFLFNSEKGKRKYWLFLIINQSLAMLMLSTRVAVYGTFLVSLTIILIYIILRALRKQDKNNFALVFTLIISLVLIITLPFTPCYQNQKIDEDSYLKLVDSEPQREKQAQEYEKAKTEMNLEMFSSEWYAYYLKIYEENSSYLKPTPKEYYEDWYKYSYDPQFWCDVIFEYSVQERNNGRQIQNIFTQYKWQQLSTNQKLLGHSYSNFMHGGILIEEDFKQQFYSLGVIGFSLLCLPFLVLLIYLGIKLLINYKKWDMLNITLLMALAVGLLAGYVSGHTIDQLSSSLLLSSYFAYLLKRLK